jgi:chromate transporter
MTWGRKQDGFPLPLSTPGPIGVNMATYTGYNCAGIPGAVVATLGLITPSLIIIVIIAKFLQSYCDNRYMGAVFYGLRPASTGLISAAGVSVLIIALANTELFRSSGYLLDLFRWKAILLAAVIWVLTNFVKPVKKLHPVVFLAVSAAAGIVFKFGGA